MGETVQSAMEDRWIDWCIQVLSADHQRACDKVSGAPEEGFDGDGWRGIRWPGYLGARFEPGGLLFIANVHRDLASRNVDPVLVDDLVEATRRLLADPQGSRARTKYLTASRSLYLCGLGKDHWNVGRPIRHILDQLGVCLDEVAYTNAAKCQQLLHWKADANTAARKCIQTFDPGDLAALLNAGLTITCSAAVADHLSESGSVEYYLQQGWSHARLRQIVEVARRL